MKIKQILLALGIMLMSGISASAQESDSANCQKYLSLYYQYLKQGMYRDAMTFWSQAYTYCGAENIETKTLINGRIGYLKLMDAAEQDQAKRTELRDTVYWIYELIIQKDSDPEWKAKYGSMLVSEDDTRYGKIDTLFQESIHVMKGETSPSHIKQYFKHLLTNHFNKATEENKEEVRNFIIEEYMLLSDYCAAGASAQRGKGDEDEAKKYDAAQDFLDKYFIQIVNDTKMLTDVIDKKMNSLPQSKEEKSKKVNAYIQLLDKKKAQSTETYGRLMDTLLTLDPTAEAYYKTGYFYQENGNDAKALDYFQKAVDMEGDGANKDKYLYGLCNSQYSNKKYSAAYKTANLVGGEYKGKAYVIAGNSIAATANGCGETTFARKANYWLANDYYKKAAANGVDVSTSKFLDNAPTAEECFNEGVTMGSSVSLSCWGETTIAR